MKKLFLILAMMVSAIQIWAQAPQKMSFEAVVRNSRNLLITGKPVGMKISVIQGTGKGLVVFSETHTPTTNDNGLISLEIGTGIPVTGTFQDVDWASGPYLIKTETDPTGGTNYSIEGTSQLLSVPYALYANEAGEGGTCWELTGNSGTNPASNFIGTTDNQPLIIKSNNQPVAEFQTGSNNNYISTSSQRTGIGIMSTGAPTHTLEVGLADIGGGSHGVLGIRGTSYMTHFNYSANEDVYIRGGKNGATVSINDIPGLGNVGIGTNTPESKLHITGTLRADAIPMASPGYFGSLISGGVLHVRDNAGKFFVADGEKIQALQPPFDPNDAGNRANKFLINPYGGNVGIGTTNPTNKLSVNGDIRSKEIIVETINWPDYVFNKKYELKPLLEVENFILQNNHLPNIPAAKEIEQSGLNLGEMQKMMMEKIEELTLYIIALKKEIDSLKQAK